MAININTLGVTGTVLICSGVIALLASIALLVAASTGISPATKGGEPSHDTYYILVDWKLRIGLLLPLVAGIILVGSGFLVRGLLGSLEAALRDSSDSGQSSAVADADRAEE